VRGLSHLERQTRPRTYCRNPSPTAQEGAAKRPACNSLLLTVCPEVDAKPVDERGLDVPGSRFEAACPADLSQRPTREGVRLTARPY
jgi:hypothetical protein